MQGQTKKFLSDHLETLMSWNTPSRSARLFISNNIWHLIETSCYASNPFKFNGASEFSTMRLHYHLIFFFQKQRLTKNTERSTFLTQNINLGVNLFEQSTTFLRFTEMLSFIII